MTQTKKAYSAVLILCALFFTADGQRTSPESDMRKWLRVWREIPFSPADVGIRGAAILRSDGETGLAIGNQYRVVVECEDRRVFFWISVSDNGDIILSPFLLNGHPVVWHAPAKRTQ